MWTTVVPNELDVYIDAAAGASIHAALSPPSMAGSEGGAPSSSSRVLWTGARVRTEQAFRQFVQTLDALAAASEDGTFFVVPAVGGVWCDLALLSSPPQATVAVAPVDFILSRGLHLGAFTESGALTDRPLLQRSARLALVTALACHAALGACNPGMVDHAAAAIRGMQQASHPLAGFVPPRLLRCMQEFPVCEDAPTPAAADGGVRRTRSRRRQEDEAAARHRELARALLDGGDW